MSIHLFSNCYNLLLQSFKEKEKELKAKEAELSRKERVIASIYLNAGSTNCNSCKCK